ncbi:MAG TPA: hypothetical protein VKP00_12045 [Gemmatimonadaceae bacterium]|nr:hypothetical protein [Gemmatimonadaceae bacterium]
MVVVPDAKVRGADGEIEIAVTVLSGPVVPLGPPSPPQLAVTSQSASTRQTGRDTCTGNGGGGA